MAKIVIIHCCDECPNFDNEYYSYNEECDLLNRKIKERDTIPDDCPLADIQISC